MLFRKIRKEIKGEGKAKREWSKNEERESGGEKQIKDNGEETGEKIKEEDPLLKSLLHCYHCHNKLQIVKKNDKYKDKVKVRKYVICSTASRKVTNKICNNKKYINYPVLM